MVSRIIIISAAVFLIAQAFSIDPFKIDKVPLSFHLLIISWIFQRPCNNKNKKSKSFFCSAMGEIQESLQQDLPLRLGGS